MTIEANSAKANAARSQASKAAFSAKSMHELVNAASLPCTQPEALLVERRLAEMPATCRKTYLKAMKGDSLAAAVKSFCMECVTWDRAEVRECTSPACPLYQYRPYK